MHTPRGALVDETTRGTPWRCVRLIERGERGRAAFLVGSRRGDAILRFGLRVGCRLANYARIESPGGESKELNPVGRREDLRKQRTLLGKGPKSSNGARIHLHRTAMMLSTTPAARRKIRLRIGIKHGRRRQQAEQTQQHACNRSSHICILPLG